MKKKSKSLSTDEKRNIERIDFLVWSAKEAADMYDTEIPLKIRKALDRKKKEVGEIELFSDLLHHYEEVLNHHMQAAASLDYVAEGMLRADKAKPKKNVKK